MKLVDSHTHLYLEQFNSDIDHVVKRALDAGVSDFFLPNIDVSSLREMELLCDRFPQVMHPMVGLHPCSVKGDYQSQLEKLRLAFNPSKHCAVGEIGIDRYWDESHLTEQITAFKTQVEWAKEWDIPIVIHVRNAFDDIFEAMDEIYEDGLRGVFHCFTGNAEQAKRILDYPGFLLGIGGVATFKNGGLDASLTDVPLKRMVLETDSPYLAPAPHRGKRNESSYIELIAERLAAIKNTSLNEVASITTSNALELFGKA